MTDRVSRIRNDYRASKHSGTRRTSSIKYFVIHTAEAALPEGGAEAVGRYFESQAARGSSQYGIDTNSTQRYLGDAYIAWGAPPLNVSGLHVECAGHAKYDRKTWLTTYARMMERLGWLVQNRCKRYGIPMRVLTPAELRKKGTSPQSGGIVTHATINKVWDESDHWDPGPNFPLDVVMAWADHYAQGILKSKTSKRVLHIHNEGPAVTRLQNDLKALGLLKIVNGKFTAATETAVKTFQKQHGIKPTGIVDRATWRALDKA